jgi:long-chain-acyl-CoA dehydrogenase
VRRGLYEPDHDARVQTIYGGTSEVMKTIIARDVTGLRT